MNELYSKLNDDTKDIYSYLNQMVNDMNNLFIEINRYIDFISNINFLLLFNNFNILFIFLLLS